MDNFLDYDDNWLTQHQARFTAMEIWQQPDLWETLGDELAQAQPIWQAFLTPPLAQPGLRIILSGAGSSAFVGRALAPWLREQSGYDVHAWGTTDIVATPHKYLDTARPTLLISFGRSGDSPESVAAVELASQIVPDCHHLIIACNPDSQLGRYAQQNRQRALMLTMPEGSHDQSFAMTSSFSCMLLAGALVLGGMRRPAWREELHGMTARCRTLRTTLQQQVKALARSGFQRYITLGSGEFAGIAEEGALKMLELTAGQVATRFDTPLGLRHGPKFMIDDKTLVILMSSPEEYARRYEQDLWRELQRDGRAQRVVVLSQRQEPQALALYDTPHPLWLMFPYLLFLQMLAFETSLAHEMTPDNPSPQGEVNRVVKGVTIYPFSADNVVDAKD